MNKIHTLNKEKLINNCQCFEEYAFVDSDTHHILVKYFTDYTYNDTWLELINIGDLCFILKSSYIINKIELIKLNEKLEFVERFLVSFEYGYQMDNFIKFFFDNGYIKSLENIQKNLKLIYAIIHLMRLIKKNTNKKINVF